MDDEQADAGRVKTLDEIRADIAPMFARANGALLAIDQISLAPPTSAASAMDACISAHPDAWEVGAEEPKTREEFIAAGYLNYIREPDPRDSRIAALEAELAALRAPPAPQAKPGIPARALARGKARVGLWVRDE